ncbi:MAG: DUF4142 domain-containing protein [Gemmatimonadota bacterium]|nr:DUF4142 domain-containing protein [Gemmatimonadota bacterium]
MLDRHTTTRVFGALTLAATLAIGACATDDRADLYDTTAVMAGDTAFGARDTMIAAGELGTEDDWTDGQILGLLAAINTGEVAAAEVAKTKATHADVRAFAVKLETEHSAMLRSGEELARSANVASAAPEDSGLIKDANDDMEDLREKERGNDWDKEYLDKQIDIHEDVIENIDKALRNADNAQLRELLQMARPKVEAHLTEARQIKERLDDRT